MEIYRSNKIKTVTNNEVLPFLGRLQKGQGFNINWPEDTKLQLIYLLKTIKTIRQVTDDN